MLFGTEFNESDAAISTDGGVQPLWSSDGDELFYRGPRGMMTVPVETDPTSAQAIPRCCSSNRLAATAHVALTTLPPTAGS